MSGPSATAGTNSDLDNRLSALIEDESPRTADVSGLETNTAEERPAAERLQQQRTSTSEDVERLDSTRSSAAPKPITQRDRSGTMKSQRVRRPSVARRPSEQGIVGRLRGVSISNILDANPAPGMWTATAAAIAQAPNLTQLRDPTLARNISFNAQGHNIRTVEVPESTEEETEMKGLRRVATIPLSDVNAMAAEEALAEDRAIVSDGKAVGTTMLASTAHEHRRKKHNWLQTIGHGLRAFWKFFITPTGFLITIYGLNIVGWGAMLFFLLLKAAPAMCHPNCDDDSSARKIWLEIDSQILNALFCVTAFGLAPWRFNDLWLALRSRLANDEIALQKLADKNNSWFRISHDLSEPCLTATGERAPATSRWKLDFVVWLMVMNTVLQSVLAGFMWGYDRFDRPGWASGTFIALGCGSSMVAGIMTWWEGRKLKIIEGPAIELQQKDDGRDESDIGV